MSQEVKATIRHDRHGLTMNNEPGKEQRPRQITQQMPSLLRHFSRHAFESLKCPFVTLCYDVGEKLSLFSLVPRLDIDARLAIISTSHF